MPCVSDAGSAQVKTDKKIGEKAGEGGAVNELKAIEDEKAVELDERVNSTCISLSRTVSVSLLSF